MISVVHFHPVCYLRVLNSPLITFENSIDEMVLSDEARVYGSQKNVIGIRASIGKYFPDIKCLVLSVN
jgi:hypothetical protein